MKKKSRSTSLIKRGELSCCPRCKQEDAVELTCDREIFFCCNCAWSFNLRIFSSIVMSDIMGSLLKGFKRMMKRFNKAAKTVGETFESFGAAIRKIDEMVKEEERKKELAEKDLKL